MFHHRKKEFNTEPHRSERSSFGTLKLNGMRAPTPASTPTPGRSLLKTARSTDTTPTITMQKQQRFPPLFAPVGVTRHICCKLFHMDRETCTNKENKDWGAGWDIGVNAGNASDKDNRCRYLHSGHETKEPQSLIKHLSYLELKRCCRRKMADGSYTILIG